MATQLKKFDWKDYRSSTAKYPWQKWLNGKPWKLTRDKDFDCPADRFRIYIHSAARRCEMSARVTKLDDRTLVLQAFAQQPV